MRGIRSYLMCLLHSPSVQQGAVCETLAVISIDGGGVIHLLKKKKKKYLINSNISQGHPFCKICLMDLCHMEGRCAGNFPLFSNQSVDRCAVSLGSSSGTAGSGGVLSADQYLSAKLHLCRQIYVVKYQPHIIRHITAGVGICIDVYVIN